MPPTTTICVPPPCAACTPLELMPPSSASDIKTIFHVSDLHIRLSSRFEEYQSVLDEMCSFLKNRKKEIGSTALIVITGDILHAKNELSPELILFTVTFFRRLAEHFPIVFTLGNHDCLLNNKDKMDSLSAIFSNVSWDLDRYHPIFYLKHTGIYRCANFYLYVYSLWDEPSSEVASAFHDFMLGSKCEGAARALHVALYHGGVGQFRVGNHKWQLQGERTTKEFEGFDAVLLGDIHQFQQVYSEPPTFYAGSLVCQNFGETYDPHGLLEWTFGCESEVLVRHHRITNKYEFMTLEIEGGFHAREGILQGGVRVDFASQEWHGCTDGVVRVTMTERTTDSLDHAYEEDHTFQAFWKRIKKTYPNLKWSFRNVSSSRPKASSPSLTVDNRNAAELCAKDRTDDDDGGNRLEDAVPAANLWSPILKDFLSEREFEQYSEAIEGVLEKSEEPLFPSSWTVGGLSPRWSILWIEWDFLFGYGADNRIELDDNKNDKNSVIGVFGKNSSGKSTLIDIVCLLLWNKITRWAHGQSIPSEVIHSSQEKAHGKICLLVGNTCYQIKKCFSRGNNNKVQCKEEIWETLAGGTPQKKTGEQRRKSVDFIKSILGSFEDFLFLSASPQFGPQIPFFRLSQKERKDFLCFHFQLERFDRYRQTLTEKLRDLSITKNTLTSESIMGEKFQDILKTDLLRDIHHMQEEVELNESKITSLRHQENQCMDTKRDLHHKITQLNVKKTTADYQRTLRQTIQRLSDEYATASSAARDEMTLDECHLLIDQLRCSLNRYKEHETSLTKFRLDLSRSLLRELDWWSPLDIQHLQRRIDHHVEQVYHQYTLHGQVPPPSPSEEDPQETTPPFSIQDVRTHLEKQSEIDFDVKMLTSQLDLHRGHVLDASEEPAEKCTSTSEQADEKAAEKCMSTSEQAAEKCMSTFEEAEKCMRAFQDGFWSSFQTEWTEVKCRLEFYVAQRTRLEKEWNDVSDVEYNADCEACRKNPHRNRRDSVFAEMEGLRLQIDAARAHLAQKWTDLQENQMLRYLLGNDQRYREVFPPLDAHQHHPEFSSITHFGQKLFLLIQTEMEHIQRRDHRKLAAELQARMKSLQRRKVDVSQKLDALRRAQEEHFWRVSFLRPLRERVLNDWSALPPLQHIHNEIQGIQHVMRRANMLSDIQQKEREVADIESYLALEHEKIIVESQINELSQSRRSLEFKNKHYQEQYGILQSRYEQYLQTEGRLREIDKELPVLEHCTALLHRNKIPSYFLRRYLTHIQNRVNEVLHEFIPQKKVSLQQSRENGDIHVQLGDGDSTGSQNFLGGMEEFLMDIAFKIALSEVSNRPQCSLFLIDEGISVLDKDNLSRIPQVFDFITTYFKTVIVISHILLVQDFVDKKIVCETNHENFRKIKF